MEAKRPRLSSDDYLESSFNNQEQIIQEFIRKSINVKISEMHLSVRSTLTSKNNSIYENKIAFSSVARENKNMSEGNNFLRKQLDESFKLISKKDEVIVEMENEIEVKNKEIIENKQTIEEINESEEKYEKMFKGLVAEIDALKHVLIVGPKLF